jgi:DNA-binding response OmpR family regulator
MKILIADSHGPSRQLLSSRLVELGHDVTVISERLHEVEELSTLGEARIALLDHSVPGANCPEVLREIRKRCGQNIYIILLTEPNVAEGITTELESAVDDLLLKPFTEPELRTHVRTATRVLELQNGRFKTQRLLFTAAMCDALTSTCLRASTTGTGTSPVTRCCVTSRLHCDRNFEVMTTLEGMEVRNSSPCFRVAVQPSRSREGCAGR